MLMLRIMSETASVQTEVGAHGVGNGLRQVFPNGDIYVVTDDQELMAYAIERQLRAVRLDDVPQLPEGANCVVFLRQNLVNREIRRLFRGMGALVVPLRAFDSGWDVSRYTLDLVMQTDYDKACELNRYWAQSIEEEPGAIVFHAEGPDDGTRTHLVCKLAEALSANTWLTPEITTNKWVSVGSYCELSITAPSTSDWTGAFMIEGTAVCAGALVAQDSRCTSDGEARIEEAKILRDEMAAIDAPIVLRIHEGVMESCRVGDRDFTERVRQATNPKYDLHVLELGIGTNMDLMPKVNWKLNSQMNEGAGPVHLGFGEGITGAHMDFIVAEGGHKFSRDS